MTEEQENNINGTNLEPKEDINNPKDSGLVFVRGVGMISKEEVQRAPLEEVIGGVFVGVDFNLADLEKVHIEVSEMRRNGHTSERELSLYHDEVVHKIERKLLVRQALKYKTI
jgi:hypothetical protein